MRALHHKPSNPGGAADGFDLSETIDCLDGLDGQVELYKPAGFGAPTSRTGGSSPRTDASASSMLSGRIPVSTMSVSDMMLLQ
jgi:hypothetical protein